MTSRKKAGQTTSTGKRVRVKRKARGRATEEGSTGGAGPAGDGAREGGVEIRRDAGGEREADPGLEDHHRVTMELAMGLSELFQVLTDVRAGNLDARVSDALLTSNDELMARLGAVLNEAIAEIQTQHVRVEEYHSGSMELAMGLSECFQVLADVREGKLDSRVSDAVLASNDELMARLGELINGTLESLAFLASQAQAIAADRLSEDILDKRVPGQVGNAFAQMTEKLRSLAEQADAIAADELDAEVLQQEWSGTLGSAFGHMVDNLQLLTAQARAIASGDLEAGILDSGNVKGSLGGSFTRMAESLRSDRGRITSAAQELKASANEILAVGKQTENNAADEASAVDETLRTMQSLLEAANDIAEGAQSVLESAEQSDKASTVIGERVAKLNSKAHEITDISETIRSIADKSDILALNASLEGTKAGEVGRGIALVGAEMRRLAETVMGAVRQIKQLSRDIQELSQSAVLASEEGQKLAARTKETSRRIALASAQQRSGTAQVSRSMDEVQQYTQQALSGSKQAVATAGYLARTAEELTALITNRRNPADEGGRSSGDP